MRLILLFVGALITGNDAQSTELVMSHVLWRHGDRSPSSTYPNDPYQESAWPQGWSQLTQYGMQQCYRVGQLLRAKYVDEWAFINKQYKREEIYIRSSDIDRSIQSALVVASGLYPPEGNQVWNSNIIWQPIPVHTFMPLDQDLLLKPTTTAKANCKAYKDYLKGVKKAMQVEFAATNQDLMDYVQQYSGYDVVDLDAVDTVASASTWERVHNLTQPAWLDAQWKSTGKTVYEVMAAISDRFELAESSDPILAKFLAGFLLDEMVDHMTSVKNGTYAKTDPKMIMYSAHSGTLTALLENMGIQLQFQLPTAALLMLDLYYSHHTSTYYIQMGWSLDQITRQVVPLKTCSDSNDGTGMCTLTRFVQTYKDRMYDTRADWDQDCKVTSE